MPLETSLQSSTPVGGDNSSTAPLGGANDPIITQQLVSSNEQPSTNEAFDELLPETEQTPTAVPSETQVLNDALQAVDGPPLSDTIAEQDTTPAVVTPAPKEQHLPYRVAHYVRVDEGDKLYEFPAHTAPGLWEKLDALYPPVTYKYDEQRILAIVYNLPESSTADAWRTETKSALCCAFNATNEFLQKNLGRALDSDDKKWYENHPYTTASGLPSEYTIGVLNKLVELVGVGIDRVYLRKGMTTYEEHKAWWEILGVNPGALPDKFMSNSEFVQFVLSQVPAEMKELMEEATLADCENYRFEYVDELPTGQAYVTFAGGYNPNNKSTAGGGHASYCGARGRPQRWEMAVTFALKSDCVYHASIPEIPEGGPGILTLDCLACTIEIEGEFKGKKIRELMWGNHTRYPIGGYRGGQTHPRHPSPATASTYDNFDEVHREIGRVSDSDLAAFRERLALQEQGQKNLPLGLAPKRLETEGTGEDLRRVPRLVRGILGVKLIIGKAQKIFKRS